MNKQVSESEFVQGVVTYVYSFRNKNDKICEQNYLTGTWFTYISFFNYFINKWTVTYSYSFNTH